MKRLPNVFEIKVNGIKVGGIEVNSTKLIKNVPVIMLALNYGSNIARSVVNYKIIKEGSIGHFRYNTKCLVHFGHYVFITNVIITK